MKKEPIYKEGRYAVFAEHDDDARDPYKDWDFMPPMMRFSGSSHYERIQRERDFDSGDIIRLLKPEHCDTKEKREKLLGLWDLSFSYKDALIDMVIHDYMDGDVATAFMSWLIDQEFHEPMYWRDAIEFFNRLESLCDILGIACINEQSNGYSQGDSVLIFMAATPDWLKETGLDGGNIEGLKANLMSSAKQWSAWCWGDVYGYVIKDELGERHESCWGYYGDNHYESNLLADAKGMIKHLIERDKKEEAASFEAACRDIVTA